MKKLRKWETVNFPSVRKNLGRVIRFGRVKKKTFVAAENNPFVRCETCSAERTAGVSNPGISTSRGRRLPCLYSLRPVSSQGASPFYAVAWSKSGSSPVKLSVSTRVCGDLMNLNPTLCSGWVATTTEVREFHVCQSWACVREPSLLPEKRHRNSYYSCPSRFDALYFFSSCSPADPVEHILIKKPRLWRICSEESNEF